MLTTYKEAYNTLVYSEAAEGQHKIPVGVFLDFVINPDDGTVAALWVQTLAGKKLVNPPDLVHWRSSELLIRNPDDCYDPADQPKLKRIFAKECQILGAKVYSQSTKKLLGQVRNFGFDTISPRLLSLHVRPYWWQFWQKRIISHDRIDRITEAGIFVNDQNKIKKEPIQKSVPKVIKSVDEMPKADSEEC